MDLKFLNALREANVTRQNEIFRHCNTWNASHFACAILGEVGSLAHVLKKKFRGDSTVGSISHEVADIAIYADLLGHKLNFSFSPSTFESMEIEPCTETHCLMLLASHVGDLCLTVQVHEMDMSIPFAMRGSVDSNLYQTCVILATFAKISGIDLKKSIIEKFNLVSDERGSLIRLADPSPTANECYGCTEEKKNKRHCHEG